MTPNLEKYKKNLSALITLGEQLYMAIQFECYPEPPTRPGERVRELAVSIDEDNGAVPLRGGGPAADKLGGLTDDECAAHPRHLHAAAKYRPRPQAGGDGRAPRPGG